MSGKDRTKKNLNLKIAALLAALVFSLVIPAGAQAPPPKPPGPPPAPKVFLDWPGADMEFFRAEIPFVEFVARLEEAQVHVVIKPERAGDRDGFAASFTGIRE